MCCWFIWRKSQEIPGVPGNETLARSPVGGPDREALSPKAVDEVHGTLTGIGGGSLIYQNVDLLDFESLVTVLRLIQSQTQSGPASSKALEHDPKALALILFQYVS